MPGEQEQTSLQSEFSKIGQKIEEVLFGIVLLTVRVFRTALDFSFRPKRLAGAIDPNAASPGEDAQTYARPLLFVLFAVILSLTLSYSQLILISGSAGDNAGAVRSIFDQSSIVEFTIGAITSFNLAKVVVVIAPTLFTLASTAYWLWWLARRTEHQVTYYSAITIVAYFFGTLAILNIVVLLPTNWLLGLNLAEVTSRTSDGLWPTVETETAFQPSKTSLLSHLDKAIALVGLAGYVWICISFVRLVKAVFHLRWQAAVSRVSLTALGSGVSSLVLVAVLYPMLVAFALPEKNLADAFRWSHVLVVLGLDKEEEALWPSLSGDTKEQPASKPESKPELLDPQDCFNGRHPDPAQCFYDRTTGHVVTPAEIQRPRLNQPAAQ